MLLDSSDEEDSFEKEMNNYLKFTKNDDGLEDGDDLEAINNKKKIIKKYQAQTNKNKISFNLILSGLLAILFGLGNMFGIYILQNEVRYKLIQINANTISEGHYLSCLNTHRQAFLDKDYRNTNTTALSDSVACIENYFQIENQLFDFQQYVASKSSTFIDLFEETYFKNSCKIIITNATFDDCLTLLDGNLAYGLNSAQQHIFSWMDVYNSMIKDSSINA